MRFSRSCDADQLQEEYAKAAQALAARFLGDTQVLGYEVMNEPIGVDDTIAVFNAAIAAALRAADPGHLVLFEPSATRNFTNGAPISSQPFAVPGGVYSVHVYTGVFGSSTIIADGTYPPLLASSISGARDEADGWKTPLVTTEVGIGSDNPPAGEWLGHFLADADAQLAPWTLWLWKEESQGEWGLYTHNDDGSWSLAAGHVRRRVAPLPAGGGRRSDPGGVGRRQPDGVVSRPRRRARRARHSSGTAARPPSPATARRAATAARTTRWRVAAQARTTLVFAAATPQIFLAARPWGRSAARARTMHVRSLLLLLALSGAAHADASLPSPRSSNDTFCEFNVFHQDTGAPMPGVRYRVTLPGGVVRRGRVPANGIIHINVHSQGSCTLDLDLPPGYAIADR